MTESKNAFFRKHPDPVVELLLNCEPTPEGVLSVLSNSPLANHPKVQAMMVIGLAEAGVRSQEEANELAESTYQLPCHADLQLLFLAAWYSMLLNLEDIPVEQVSTLQTSMNALVTKDTPPELVGVVRFLGSHTAAVLGDYREMVRLLHGVFDDVPRDSPYYAKLVTISAMGYMGAGMGADIVPYLKEISPSKFDELGLLLCNLVNSTMTGNIEGTPDLVQKAATFSNHKYMRYMRRRCEMCCTLIAIMSQAKGAPVPSPLLVQSESEMSSWARSTRALLERKPDEALYWARRDAEEGTVRSGEIFTFVEHVLVRAELAMGNVRAAKRLLDKFREGGTETYFDDFFHARVALLLGNRDSAARHLAILRESVERYEASGRFEFEVTLATELSVGDLIALSAAPVVELSTETLAPVKVTPPRGVHAIVSVSDEMSQVKSAVTQFADLHLPVLVSGETGTGKELVARAIHEASKRAKRPFIAINCGAIPDALIESELFGHASGAFTGANSAYQGIFREAGEGTVFLDEIAGISPRLQMALLRVLETNEVRPVGSSSNLPISCRIVAASNEDLRSVVESENFRKDLYFRLQRLEVYIPPLRKRTADIVPLTRYFLDRGRESGELTTLAPGLIDRLEQHQWPGNVRELRNIVERMRILSSDKLDYAVEDLLQSARLGERTPKPSTVHETKSFSPEHTQSKEQGRTPMPGEIRPGRPESEIQRFLASGHTTMRRKHRLRELFEEVGALKVSEAAALLGVSSRTASRYMAELCEEGFIEKVTPTKSRKSHYYARCSR